MAFLRSGKFFRFLSAGKNLVNFREYESTHQLPAHCVCSAKNFATASAMNPSDTLDKSLKRLDNDVRRSGRISRRDLEEILEEIRTNKAATSSQSLLVIRCCGNLVPEEMPEARTKMVQQIWKTLSKLNVPMDISHYNALLRVYLENEYKFSPTEFLADLQAKGIEPNRVTYQRIITSYCQQGDISGATQILEFMREKQLPVNEIVFNALIMGHSNCDDLESATGILGFMAQAGLQPSADTYTTLLCGFARAGDMDSINKYIEKSEQEEISLLDKDYLEVIYALAVNGHESKVDEVLPKIKKSFGYNQDAINVILRLINKGKETTSLNLLKTMVRGTRSTGEQTDAGNFLIKQLVKANRPVEQIVQICNELEANNMNSKPTIIAVEAALSSGQVNISKVLLRELKAKGIEVRQHYFWPIICAAKNQNEVIEVFALMDEFKMTPNNTALRDFVIPKLLKGSDYYAAIQALVSVGVSQARAAAEVAYVAVLNNHIDKAADIMSSHDSYYKPTLFEKYLTDALHRTQDFDSYIKIIRRVIDNLERDRDANKKHFEEDEASESGTRDVQSLKEQQAQVVGDFVLDAVFFFKKDRVQILENILERLVDQGLSILSVKAQRIQEKLGEDLTEKISTLLGKLVSGDLEPIAYEKQRAPRFEGNLKSPTEWERLIARTDEKGENSKRFRREWLISAIRAKDIQKSEEIMAQLKTEGFILGSGVYAQLIELYASENKTDEAIEMLKNLRATDPAFNLDEVKLLKIVQSFVNADKVDEAIKFIEQNKIVEPKEEKQFNHQNTSWRLLNTLAEKGKVAELNSLFEALVANNYIIANNALLGPLIKVHIIRDETKEALDKFEEICKKHRATPWKNEIANRLIQAEDAVGLQRLTDLSTEIHGEVNSLYDLVFSFIECGRVRQARKILETPGLQSRQVRINSACEKYLSESKATALEGLIEATKDLNHIDRSEIYHTLLKTYIKEAAPEKGLELWTAMQEEGVTPSDKFLTQLAAFLKENDVEVPFHVPEPVVRVTKETKAKPDANANKQKPAADKKESSPTTSFKKALDSANLELILKSFSKLPADFKPSVFERSLIIQALLRENRIEEASTFVFQMLEENLHPTPKIFRYYLNQIAKAGDTATIEKVAKHLTPEVKRLVSIDNRICHSFIAGGNAEEYLYKLESVIDNATTPEELAKAGEEFPRGGAQGILNSFPELMSKYEKIALKYAEKQIIPPMNVLWADRFLNNDPRADEIFEKYLSNYPRISFHRLVEEGRKNMDVKLAQRLVDHLSQSKISEGGIGNAYSFLIDMHVAKEDAESCLTAINACLEKTCLENVNRTALVRAKECVEKAGKNFPHTIPDKKPSKQHDSSSSSSSSSSDDEVTRKKASS